MGNKESKTKDIITNEKSENAETQYFLLAPIEHVKKVFYAKNNYAWIDKNVLNNENQFYVKAFLKQFETQTFTTLEQAVKFIDNSSIDTINVICSASNGNQVNECFEKNKKVKQIYIFCGYLPAGQEIMRKYKKVKAVTNTIQNLIKTINQYKFIQNERDLMPAFSDLQISTNPTGLTELRIALYCLLKMKNKAKAKYDFVEFAKTIKPDRLRQIRLFDAIYGFSMDPEIVIKQYMKESFYYSLINNSLRLLKNPTELAYVRFPLVELYSSIKKLYLKENKNQGESTLKVHKKTYLTVDDIQFYLQNVGNFIQAQGFLFASLDDCDQQQNQYNTKVEIVIQDKQKDSQSDEGYLIFEQIKSKRILFNILNIFKLEYVEKDKSLGEKKINFMRLRYGELPSIVWSHKQNMNLSENDQKILSNYQTKMKIVEKNLRSQGDALHFLGQYNEAITQKSEQLELFIKKYGSTDIKCGIVMYYLANSYYHNKNYKKAQQFYQQALNISKIALGDNNPDLCKLYENMALNCKAQNKFEDALIFYLKSQKNWQNFKGKKDFPMAKLFQQIGELFSLINKNEESIKYYEDSLSFYSNCHGDSLDNISKIHFLLAKIYLKKNNYEKSVQNSLLSLKIRCQPSLEFNQKIIDAIKLISVTLNKSNDPFFSFSKLIKAFEITFKLKGKDNIQFQKINEQFDSVIINLLNTEPFPNKDRLNKIFKETQSIYPQHRLLPEIESKLKQLNEPNKLNL